MRVFIAAIILIFSLQSFTKADDIRDLEIEGISLGDSAVDYFTEEEIISLKNSYKDKGYIYHSKKFYSITFRNHSKLQIYQHLQLILKDKDKSYKIYAILGVIDFMTNINQCYKKLDLIENELDKLFVNTSKSSRERIVSSADKDSTIERIAYFIGEDIVVASCADWSEKMEIADALRVNIRSEAFNFFLLNEAYN